MELAKARLALDQDELSDAQEDLSRQGGDQHSKLERLLQEHEAAQHQPVQSKSNAARTQTLAEQVLAWFSLRERAHQVESALEQTTKTAAALDQKHQALEKSGNTGADVAATLSGLRLLSDQKKTLTEFDKRIQDSQQLSDVYKRWNALLDTRKRVVLHLLLISSAIVLAILLVVVCL